MPHSPEILSIQYSFASVFGFNNNNNNNNNNEKFIKRPFPRVQRRYFQLKFKTTIKVEI